MSFMKCVVSIVVAFGLLLVTSVSFASLNPIEYTLSPSNGFGPNVTVGDSYTETYTLTNTLPKAETITQVSQTIAGGTFNVTDNCSGHSLAASGGYCTVVVNLVPAEAGFDSIQLSLHYDNNVVPLPASTATATGGGTSSVSETITQGLPGTITHSTAYPITAIFTNTGTNAVTLTGVVLTPSGGTNSAITYTPSGCNTAQLAHDGTCQVSMTLTTDLVSSVVSEQIQYNYNYTGGSSDISKTTSGSIAGSCVVQGNTILPLPGTTYEYADNVVEFSFTNYCNSSQTLTTVNLTGNLNTMGQATPWITKGSGASDACSGATLSANGGTCIVYASVVPQATSTGANQLAVTAQTTYNGGTSVSSSTGTTGGVLSNSTTNRMVTIINQCPMPVWMTFNAAAVQGSPVCASNSDCPTGSVCDTDNSTCYYTNPSLDGQHTYGELAAAVSGQAPDTMNVAISETNSGSSPVNNVIYNGGILARLGCTATGNPNNPVFCTVNNCGGTVNPVSGSTEPDGQCAPGIGSAVSTPGMSFNAGEMTFLYSYGSGSGQSTTDGVYDEQTINGVNVPLEMKGRGPFGSGAPYNDCEGAGALIPQTESNQLGACLYNYTTPTTLPSGGAASPSNYKYVTYVDHDGCTSDASCTTSGTVCGLAYHNYGGKVGYKLTTACGQLEGYVSINTGICSQASSTLTSAVQALQTSYNCSTEYPSSTNEYGTGANLYACNNTNAPTVYYAHSCYNPLTSPTPQPDNSCCGCYNWWDAGITVPAAVTTSCPYTGVPGHSYDSGDWNTLVKPQIQWVKSACPTAYAYQFDDPSSSFHCTVTNGSNQIVTSYQVTFCPGGKTVSTIAP